MRREFVIGEKTYHTGLHTYVMGILNVTPDSFSDGGRFCEKDQILFHARKMVESGADVIDIGGESTRPGHTQITLEEEIERVVPAVELVSREFAIPISIDTYKSKVAKAAILAGAVLVNDIWGLKYDPEMAGVIAAYGASCCLMHNRNEAVYQQFLNDILDDLKESLRIAEAAGIHADKIMLDPGIGFGKTYEMNMSVLRNLKQFQVLDYPMLLGASRKSVIGLTLDLPADQREEGTLVTTVLAVKNRYGFVRVHDVTKNKRAIQMAEAILR